MQKLFSGRCVAADCVEQGRTVDVWSEGVDAQTRTLVDATCKQCHGALQRVLTPINIGRRSRGNGGCRPGRDIDESHAAELFSAMQEGGVAVEIGVVGYTSDQGAGGMVN